MDTGGGRTDGAHRSSGEAQPLLELCLQAVLVQAESIEETAVGVGRQLLHRGLHLVPTAGGGAVEVGVAPSSVLLQTGPAEISSYTSVNGTVTLHPTTSVQPLTVEAAYNHPFPFVYHHH